jgi:hypothetical protein
VEGEADRAFFEAMCRRLGLNVDVQVTVATPKDTGQLKNTKQAAFAAIEKTYLNQLADGQTERLAIVVDADRVTDGGGFDNALAKLEQLLTPAGYKLSSPAAPGLVFTHYDGLHDLGAWVMPNNADEGALEHWIQRSMHPDESVLMSHVQASIDQIPNEPKFKLARRAKAEVATWLAWQTEPDHGVWQALKPGLLDDAALEFQALKAWLEKVFPPTT